MPLVDDPERDRAIEEENQLRRDFSATFSSEPGRRVLEYLERSFDPPILAREQPTDTYFMLGRRDVLVHVRYMMQRPLVDERPRQYEQPAG